MLKSIKQELAACREAWLVSTSKLAWCCHHRILIEPLTEPYENRIKYILSDKDESEHAVRFRNFKPVRIRVPAEWDKTGAEWNKTRAELDKAWVEWNKEIVALFNQDWPGNTWNGESIGI